MKNRLKFALSRWKGMAAAAIGLTCLILAGAIVCAQLYLRQNMRGQIVQRDGEILHAVSIMQATADKASGEFTGPPSQPESYFDTMLKISGLKGVMAVRLFDREGRFVNAFPADVEEATLPPEDVDLLRQFQPACHFNAQEDLSRLILLKPDGTVPGTAPVLAVTIPLADGNTLAGGAQFVMEGETVAAAFAALDQHLAWQGLLIFVVGGSLAGVGLTLAFRRVDAMSRRLVEANQELALTARTNAVGAVTSHLVHGLKNSLGSVQVFVQKNRGRGVEDAEDAAAAVNRMKSLIAEVLGILRDRDSNVHYEISLKELRNAITARIFPIASFAGVPFEVDLTAEGILGNRDANLVCLVVESLVQNAIEATPRGRPVFLRIGETPSAFEFAVTDQGPGFPEELREDLFKPCRSTKPGGGGIGLAICRQLASQMEARLALSSNTPDGCVFTLTLPKVKSLRAEPSTETVAA